jgi:hypothetical protein
MCGPEGPTGAPCKDAAHTLLVCMAGMPATHTILGCMAAGHTLLVDSGRSRD